MCMHNVHSWLFYFHLQISTSVDKCAGLKEKLVACEAELADSKLKYAAQQEELTKLR